jgi:hypothetical protein
MGHVAHVGELWNAYKILVSNPQAKKPVGRQGTHGIILKLILKE